MKMLNDKWSNMLNYRIWITYATSVCWACYTYTWNIKNKLDKSLLQVYKQSSHLHRYGETKYNYTVKINRKDVLLVESIINAQRLEGLT